MEQHAGPRSPNAGLVMQQTSWTTGPLLARAGLRSSGCYLPHFSLCSTAAGFFWGRGNDGSTSPFESWLCQSTGNPHLPCWWEEEDEILNLCWGKCCLQPSAWQGQCWRAVPGMIYWQSLLCYLHTFDGRVSIADQWWWLFPWTAKSFWQKWFGLNINWKLLFSDSPWCF